MSSRLVETVMINVEDFAENFLTCGTCFCCYDNQEHAAKLLPCSHTICLSCLDRIFTTQSQSESFRCPICRETINIPSGGASSFPPAFIVNQLLDLLATQRRDIVPKCRIHPNQELLFCETCDLVFCCECRGPNHASRSAETSTASNQADASYSSLEFKDESGIGSSLFTGTLTEGSGPNSGLNHNVISFNVAIKRCSEIMLYKMHLCVRELDNAQRAVSTELERLQANKNLCIASINSKFAEIVALVDRRRMELLDSVKRLEEEKRNALTDQLSLIETERDLVRQECSRLKGVLDVRSITKAISFLNDKLDTIASLTEPRENAFLIYQDWVTSTGQQSNQRANADSQFQTHTRSSTIPLTDESPTPSTRDSDVVPNSLTNQFHQRVTLLDIARCLAGFGKLVISTTYPALCTARLPDELITNLHSTVIIQAVDYNGCPQSTSGADPVEAQLVDLYGFNVPTTLVNLGNGSYELTLLPLTSGIHKLSVQILNRPIRGSPFQLPVKQCQKRRWFVHGGSDGRGLIQPFAVSFGPYPTIASSSDIENSPASDAELSISFVYLLDTGNSRMLVLNPQNGQIHTTLVGEAMSDQAATGMTWSPQGLWVVNWRARKIFLLDPRTDQVLQCISSPDFKEPTSVARCPSTGRLFVADNGAGCIFSCDPESGSVVSFIDSTNTDAESAVKLNKRSNPPSTMRLDRFRRPISGDIGKTNQNCKRITGLSVADTGELILSAGSTIRIYSAEGKFLTDLHPPIEGATPTRNAPPFIRVTTNQIRGTTMSSVLNTNTLRNELRGTNVLDGDSEFNQTFHHPESRPLSSSTMRPSNTYRGQFGGVTVGYLDSPSSHPSAYLGRCILASFTDRKCSGVVVWPESAWARHAVGSSDDDNCLDSSHSDHSALDVTSCEPPCTTIVTHTNGVPKLPIRPYIIEADPGFRRLAGLATLPTDRHVIVVDQGAQSISCVRYA